MFTYHRMRGIWRDGLVVGPGANTGLICTCTLLQHVVSSIWPSGRDVSSTPSSTVFAGISGSGEPGLSQAQVPSGIAGSPQVSWTAGMLGGTGSRCPSLRPLEPVLQYHHGFIANTLPRRGSILIIVTENRSGDLVCRRCSCTLSTDTGHYLLPTGRCDGKGQEEQRFPCGKVREYSSRLAARNGGK